MIKSEVMDIVGVCQSFPDIPDHVLDRPHILDSIDDILVGDTKLVVLEGAGMGKTTLLAQFALRHQRHVAALFVRPTSRWGYDPAMLRFDLANQLQWHLHGNELHSVQDADDALLGQLLMELGRRSRRAGRTFYFVVDGIDDIIQTGSSVHQLVLEMLPWSFPGLRFVLSGATERLASELPKGITPKSFPLPHFTLDETIRFMDGLGVERRTIEELHRTCRGVPEHLAALRRLIHSGTSPHALLQNLSGTLPRLFEMEWTSANTDELKTARIVALLAYDRKQHTVADVARILKIPETDVRHSIQPASFITIDSDTHTVTFVSEAFRSFASQRLEHLRREITRLCIDDLITEPESAAALAYLPAYLEQAERFDDLLQYLSPDHFTLMLERSQSLVPVQEKAALGVRTARRLHRDSDLVRFSMQHSALNQLARAETWRSEITARMALQDYESALRLAQNAVTKEDRLQLLAVVAKTKRQNNQSIESELHDQIRHLYAQLDHGALGERGVDIASDLIYVEPELAIDLVERASNTGSSENALDWAFATLSFRTLGSPGDDVPGTEQTADVIARIKDPGVRRFASHATLLISDHSAEQVIVEVEAIEKPEDRLYLLRRWASANRRRADAYRVVEYALSLAIRTTHYSPNARDLRELAAPLPYIPEEAIARQLVARFDSQLGTVEKLGPTEDYVRLQLLLAESEMHYAFDAARNKIVELYLYVLELEGLEMKTECLAWIVRALNTMDPTHELERLEGLHTEAETQLQLSLSHLLAGSADHYRATKGVIRAIGRVKPQMAFNLTRELNVEPRRDAALLDLVSALMRAPTGELNLAVVQTAFSAFENHLVRDRALLKVMDRLAQIDESLDSQTSRAIQMIDLMTAVQDAHERCRGYALAYRFLKRAYPEQYEGLVSQLLDRLHSAWQAIDTGWRKVNLGYTLVTMLAPLSLEHAHRHLAETQQLQEDIRLDAEPMMEAYLSAVRLAIGAFKGLLPRKLDSQVDIQALTDLVDQVPANAERAVLWARVALHFHSHRRSDDCQEIVSQRLKPLLEAISDKDGRARTEATVLSAPALYVAHRATALEIIGKLPGVNRDEAYRQIHLYLLRKQIPSEPYETPPGQGFDVTHDDLVDICGLLNLIDIDVYVYHGIITIADTLTAQRYRNRFSQQQRTDITERLVSIAKAKFPNPRFIQHDGFHVASEAQIDRIRQARSESWQRHLDAARRIPNLADRALVMTMVAAAMPGREADRRSQIFEEVATSIKDIPVALDRIDRYESLAFYAVDSEPGLAKKYLRLAMGATLEAEDHEAGAQQRKLIDIAYRLDPELAASLASIADTDPARAAARRHLRSLEMKKAMTAKSGPDIDDSQEAEAYARTAWSLLGALNAGRIETVAPDRTRRLAEVAARLPLSEAYPILAWIIENATVRFAKTDQALTHLRPLFEATVLGAELAGRITMRTLATGRRARLQPNTSGDDGVILFGAGDRTEVMSFLRSWLEQEATSYLTICDEYFGPEDLEVLKLLNAVNPTCRVSILTSQKHLHQKSISNPEEVFRREWRRLSDQEPPDTEVLVVGLASSGKSPIHDRWWLTESAGISVGTSFNSLGITQESKITRLSHAERIKLEEDVDRFFRRQREYNGERLRYTLFTL